MAKFLSMKISASVNNRLNHHHVVVRTNEVSKEINIPSKQNGLGSSVNGGELLLLSLATCFCNDIYREAAKRNIDVSGVEVEISAHFGAEGEAGSDFKYRVHVVSTAGDEEIRELIEQTDKVAEIHNTLRKGVSVSLLL